MWIGTNEKDFSLINSNKIEHITLHFDGKDYTICFHMEKRILRWRYETQKERDKALNYIWNTLGVVFIEGSE